MIKKETDKHIHKIEDSLSLHESQKETSVVQWISPNEMESVNWVQTWLRLFALPIALISLGKVWIQLSSL